MMPCVTWSCPEQRRASAALDVVAVAGAIALGAWARVPLPFSPVPMTLQTLPVLLAPFAVGRSRAMAGVLLYLALGLAGSPVFAVSFGPTFGYLLAFAMVPAVVTRFRDPAIGILAGTLTIYALGVAWLNWWLGGSLWHAVLVGAVPFLPGDALKAVAAAHLVRRMRR